MSLPGAPHAPGLPGVVFAASDPMALHRFFAMLLPLLLVGCSEVSDLTTITIGEGTIDPLVHDESYDLAEVPVSECIEGSYTTTLEDGSTATVELAEDGAACRATFTLADVVLFDEDEARSASDQLDGRDIDGVEEVRLVVEELMLARGDGSSLLTDPGVLGFTLSLDGAQVLTDAGLPVSPASPEVVVLPEATRDEVIAALEMEREARGTLVLHLELDADAFGTVPSAIDTRVVAQPEVDVDVIDAAI